MQKFFEEGHIKLHANSGKFYNTTFKIFFTRCGFTLTCKSLSSILWGLRSDTNIVLWFRGVQEPECRSRLQPES